MEELLALHRIETAVRERAASCKTEAEKKSVDLLIQRSFANDGCDWDKAHSAELFRLAVKPSEVGPIFRLQEQVHRIFPYIAEPLADLPAGTVVDGELVGLDDSGRPDFNLLQNFRGESSHMHYYIFDLLCCKDRDLTRLPKPQ
jgi:hypothetical protein